MKELLKRQKEEIDLLKSAIKQEQEERLSNKHQQYVSLIK